MLCLVSETLFIAPTFASQLETDPASNLLGMAATRRQSMAGNVPWESDWQRAFERARAEDKKVFVDFFSPG